MKNILIAAYIIFSLSGNAQTTDTINWRLDYKLKWDDFKGKLDSNSTFAAVSSIIMDYDIIGTKKNITGVTVKCIFDRNDSQLNYTNVNKILRDSTLLAHEQTHFDIAEIFLIKNVLQHLKKHKKYIIIYLTPMTVLIAFMILKLIFLKIKLLKKNGQKKLRMS
jgi:hypothetical protein